MTCSATSFAFDKSGIAIGLGFTGYASDLGEHLVLVGEEIQYHVKADYTFSNGLLIGGAFAPSQELHTGRLESHSIYAGYQTDIGLRLLAGVTKTRVENVDVYSLYRVTTINGTTDGLMLGVGYSPDRWGVPLYADLSYSFLDDIQAREQSWLGTDLGVKQLDSSMLRFTMGFKF